MPRPTSHPPHGSKIWATSLVLLHLLVASFRLPAATQAFRWSSLSNQNPTLVEGANLSSVAIGTDWSFALQADGRVISAQPGRADFYEPPPSLAQVVAIAARFYVASALRSDGRVVNWGGMVLPPPDESTDFVSIAQGVWQTIALRSDGTVAAWGNPEYPAGIDVPLNLADVIAVSSGELNSLALRANGTVASWALVEPQLANVPEAATNVIALAAGYRENFVLRADGTVVGWSAGDSAFFPSFETTDLVDIAAGPDVLLALTGDGRVLRWGRGDIGSDQCPRNHPRRLP